LDVQANPITNVQDPSNPQDAATKNYVDGYFFDYTPTITVRKNTGADVGTRPRLNFIEGANITLTVSDDAGSDEIDITIASTASGSVDLDGYLPRDGSKPMTGDLDMDGYDILNAGEINGYRTYAASATDPSSPAPADGDRYFNTSLEMWMTYDGSRSKWLSEESAYIQFGRDGFTAVGSYFRGIDGQTLSDTIGYHAFWNGTIVGAAITIESSVTSDIQFTEGGTTRATLSLTASVSERDTTLDGDFSQGGILAVRNASTGNTVDNCSGWFRVKWRA
jgi:hypothetical protein